MNERLIEAMVRDENVERAYGAVRRNKGVSGIDGMTVEGLAGHLKVHWPRIKEVLLAGEYRPNRILRRYGFLMPSDVFCVKRPCPTAVCGKPHVRWCGSPDGRNPVRATR